MYMEIGLAVGFIVILCCCFSSHSRWILCTIWAGVSRYYVYSCDSGRSQKTSIGRGNTHVTQKKEAESILVLRILVSVYGFGVKNRLRLGLFVTLPVQFLLCAMFVPYQFFLYSLFASETEWIKFVLAPHTAHTQWQSKENIRSNNEE